MTDYPLISETVCYCFGYTTEDIQNDLLQHGRSTILERIQTEKKANGCNCAANNPKGRCCLPDVHRVVNEIRGDQ